MVDIINEVMREKPPVTVDALVTSIEEGLKKLGCTDEQWAYAKREFLKNNKHDISLYKLMAKHYVQVVQDK